MAGALPIKVDEHGDVAPNGYSAQAGSTIWIVDANGSNARAVTTPERPVGGHASPSWSHDGRFIAFSVFDGLPDNGIWVDCRRVTGDLSPLDRGNSWYDPMFSKDDASVLCRRRRRLHRRGCPSIRAPASCARSAE